MPSVADVCDFVADRQPPPLDALEKLLAFDNLSPAIRLLLTAKIDAARRAANTLEWRWSGWRPFVVERVVAESAEVRSIHLRAANGAPLCQPRAGQFVSVRLERKEAEPVTRTWSLSAYSYDMSSYRLTIRNQGGPGSNRMHEVGVGDHLQLRAPTGDFSLDTGSFRTIVLVAGGIGITPLMAMLHAQLLRPHGGPIYLFYGLRTPDDVVFHSELESLAAANPDLHITYVYSRRSVDGQPTRRITPQFLIDSLRDVFVILDGHRVPLPWYEADFYLCGPGDFCDVIKADFVARGANADRIFTERFVPASVQKAPPDEAEIRFQRSGITRTWKAEDDLTVLELAERAGLEIENDCRAGSCLTCRTVIVSGSMTSELGDGSALLCIGQPKSAHLVLDC
jgi:ferredoxin-NADP reductase